MYFLDYLLIVVPLGSIFVALMVLVIRLPGTEGKMTWARLLLAAGVLVFGGASFAVASYIIQQM
ncbi:hypothetical protein VT84_10635 [Gemmata sp. SH-PL17]|uniref:hypothetical protein n=1 Tax=Gemmata sp. SH-PL17 TaxID=1630693 RepID=UPI0004B199C6|nr:hypothetical protein [Gemmata sp. SH-PL17]AMV24844.1 hypothetical protein VT84_10635 [Gemmata sp. SH-PL17]